MRELRDYQERMRDFMVERDHPAVLAQMRLGKTLAAVRAMQELDYQKILINGPINCFRSWKKELRLEGETFFEAYGCSTEERERQVEYALRAKGRTWCLMNFEGYRHVPEIVEAPWEVVGVDESVKLKNPKAQISQLFQQNFRSAKKRFILTGMIRPESDTDIFMQFAFLHGQFMGKMSFWKWREQFFEPDPYGYDWIPKKGVREVLERLVREKSFILTRKEAGFANTKSYIERSIQMNAKQIKAYNQVDKDFSVKLGEYEDETIWATEKDLWKSFIAGGFLPDKKTVLSTAKPDEIIYFLQNDLKGEQIVVMYRFEHELNHDLMYFQNKGFKCSYVKGTGKMSKRAVEENEDEFIEGKTQILLAMQKAVYYSKDYSNASAIIYRSCEASNDIRLQSEDRVVTVASNEMKLIIDLVSEDTVDESNLRKLGIKEIDANSMQSPTRFDQSKIGQLK